MGCGRYTLGLLAILVTVLPAQGCRCSAGTGPEDSGVADAGEDGGACEWPEEPECEEVDTEYPEAACSKDDWCWVLPKPAGNAYRALWDDGCTLWAGGEDGALATVDLATGALVDFVNIVEDGWIRGLVGLGDGRLLVLVSFQQSKGLFTWDGSDLEEWPMPVGEHDLWMRDIEVDFDGRLYVTGQDYDEAGQTWHAFFAVWDGSDWQRIETDLEYGLGEMRLEPCGGMYILAGRNNMFDPYMGGCGVLHWDGLTLTGEYWREEDWIFDPCDLVGIDVGEDGTAWAAGSDDFAIKRHDDGTWEEVDIDLEGPGYPYWTNFLGVAVESESSVLLSGYKTAHWNGVEWTEVPDVNQGDLLSHEARYANGSFWLSYWLREVKLPTLEVVDPIDSEHFGVNGVWVSPEGTFYATGTEFGQDFPFVIRSHDDGDSWEEMPLPPVNTEWLSAIWGLSDEDIWACGQEGTVLHHDGVEWSAVDSPVSDTLWAIWGTAADNVFLAGNESAILRWDGAGLQQMAAPVEHQNIRGIWGSGPDNIYITTGSGGIFRFDGSSWAVEMAPTGQDYFNEVVGKGPEEIYIAGSGYVWLYDGTSLTELGAGPYGEYEDITVHPVTGDVWVTGGTATLGKVLRYDGSQWHVEDTGTYAPLRDLVFSESTGMLAASGLIRKTFN